MTNKIFCIYNKLSNRYEMIFASASDGMAAKRVSQSLKSEEKEELELCRVGEIEIETGIITACAPVRIELNKVEQMPLKNTAE